MNTKTLGLLCMISASAFLSCETMYFGGNVFPKSLEELACDTFGLLLMLYGVFMYFYNRRP